MRKILYFLLILPFFVSAQNLKINEIMVINASSSFDEGSNYSAWVEVYNPGDASENLKDYTFSKTSKKDGVKTWTPGNITVPAKGYAVVYFERQDSVYYIDNQNYLKTHASFKLNVEGGSLTLVKGNLQTDHFTYPQQYRNISFGRQTDGGNTLVFFTEPSKGESNNDKASVAPAFDQTTNEITNVTAEPVFDKSAGFYSEGSISVGLQSADPDAQIYYTLSFGPTKQTTVQGKCQEPTVASTLYSAPITVANTDQNKAGVIRAFAVAPGKLPSKMVTATYFVKTRKPSLPVVSLTTDDKNLFDAATGIYNKGNGTTNDFKRSHDGILDANGNKSYQDCQGPGNYMKPWDRPANFEFFDNKGVRHISQEVDIAISGQCSRQNQYYKSFKIKAKEKYGNERLDYDFFPAKPGHKYESIVLRYSGTEGPQDNSTMFRDAFMSTQAIGFMDVDVQAYQPSILFVNGEYWGIANLRERSNDNHIYSNYGYSSSDIYFLEGSQATYPQPGVKGSKTIPYEPREKADAINFTRNFFNTADISDPAKYAQACEMVDEDSFIDYLLMMVWGENWDWPQNNFKYWRPKDNGKWRFFAFDNDFTLDNMRNLCGEGRSFSVIYNGSVCSAQEGSSGLLRDIFKGFWKNQNFKSKFLTRAQMHAATTFKTSRLLSLLDSLKNQIAPEIPTFWSYRNHEGNWNNNITTARNYINGRTASWLADAKHFTGGVATNVGITANIPNAKVSLNGVAFNVSPSDAATVELATMLPVTLQAEPVSGYKFVRWDHTPTYPTEALTLIDKRSTWKYSLFNGKDLYEAAWPNVTGDEWPEGPAPIGYGGKGKDNTSSSFGGGLSNVTVGTNPCHGVAQQCNPIGCYFVKEINIENIDELDAFEVSAQIDDAGAWYVNGVEVYRKCFPANYNITHRSTGGGYSDDEFQFSIDKSKFHNGINYIQVSIHQSDGFDTAEKDCASSSDLVFDMSLKCVRYDMSQSISTESTPEYTTVLIAPHNAQAIYEQDPDALPKSIFINEVYSAGTSQNDDADWIELYNASSEDVCLNGYTLRRTDNGNIAKSWTFGFNTIIPANGYLVVEQDPTGLNGPTFGISHSQNYTVELIDNYNVTLDVFTVDDPSLYTTYGESVRHENNDGTGPLVKETNPHKNGTVEISTVRATSPTVQVYPNPVKDVLNIRATSAIRSIVVTDVSGRTVAEKTSAGAFESIPTSSLAQGIYLVTVETEQGKAVKKILK